MATKDDLLQLAKKQEKALTRYKMKFSEVHVQLCLPKSRLSVFLTKYRYSMNVTGGDTTKNGHSQ